MANRGHRIFAAVYDPMNRAAERRWLGKRRAGLLGGDVLEIGAGTGANLRRYRAASRVTLAEPDPAMRARLLAKVGESSVRVEVVDAAAERLPFDDESFGAVVSTLVLCSVADQAEALSEVRRVLRPGGRLLFIEHVGGEGARGRWQDRVLPVWRVVAAGCHPNRDTEAAIRAAGLQLGDVERFQPKVPDVALLEGPIVQGWATR